MTPHNLLDAVKKLLPPAEAEQEALYKVTLKYPGRQQAKSDYEDCRHAVSYAYEALAQAVDFKPKPVRKKKGLPPDPENMNGDRAEWAAAALRHFQCCTGTDYDTALVDLLGDLMHWCDRNGFVFAHELGRAHDHYEAETAPDEVTA